MWSKFHVRFGFRWFISIIWFELVGLGDKINIYQPENNIEKVPKKYETILKPIQSIELECFRSTKVLIQYRPRLEKKQSVYNQHY